MKIDIQTTASQQMTCNEIDKFVKAHIGGVRTSLDEPVGGYDAPYPLDSGHQMPSSVTASDGVYSDSKEKMLTKDVTVNGTEYVRILWKDSVFMELMKEKYDILNNIISTEQLSQINTLPAVKSNTSIQSLYDLSNFPYITNIGSNSVSYCSLLTYISGRYITRIGDSFAYQSGMQRAIFPAVISVDRYFGNDTRSLNLVDFGSNLVSFGTGLLANNTDNKLTMILRSTNMVTLGSFQSSAKPKYIFVPYALLGDYKTNSVWSAASSRIFPIGGPTWKSTFATNAVSRGIAASSPYADLTAEEQSWYEELFPTLYDNWVAPTSDE